MDIRQFFKKYFDLNLTLILAGFYLITILLNLLKVFSTAALKGTPLIVGDNFFYQVYILDAFVVLGIMQLIAMHTKKLILKQTSWRKILLFHFCIALFLGVIIQVITDIYRIHIGIFETYNFKKSLSIFLSVIDINFLVYFAMLFIIYTYYYFKIIRASEMQKSNLENQLVTTKMNMLTAQLQPHFLFNTINCIVGLIDIDRKKAQDTLVDLSTFFREVTKNNNVHVFSLEKELEILGHYLAILKVRFPENLKIIEEIEPGILNRTVPAMVLQPLIENSINHGYEFMDEPLIITIKGYVKNGKLFLIVENNGPLLEDNSGTAQTGFGIYNLQQRLENLYGNAATFSLRNKVDGKGVMNCIEIPKKFAPVLP